MCGRFGLFASRESVEARFDVTIPGSDWAPRYNIAPSQAVLGISAGQVASSLRWGLIPSSTPPGLRPGRVAPAHGREWINARVETVATKAAFREAYATHRCLVPASGYFEWEGKAAVADPNEPFRLTPPSARRPHWYELAGETVFAMAGIVASWRPEPDLEPIESCAVLTTEAVPGVAAVHPRMPLILPRDLEQEWLEERPTPERLAALVEAASTLSWSSRVVGDAVNSPRNEGGALIAPR
jgi:putative SOS response-associated peptidase YedK